MDIVSSNSVGRGASACWTEICYVCISLPQYHHVNHPGHCWRARRRPAGPVNCPHSGLPPSRPPPPYSYGRPPHTLELVAYSSYLNEGRGGNCMYCMHSSCLSHWAGDFILWS